MFRCINCRYEGEKFDAEVADISKSGAFTYRAKCPNCGSLLVEHLPGDFEEDLRISIERR